MKLWFCIPPFFIEICGYLGLVSDPLTVLLSPGTASSESLQHNIMAISGDFMVHKATLSCLTFGKTVLVTADCREHWWAFHPEPSQYLTYREYRKYWLVISFSWVTFFILWPWRSCPAHPILRIRYEAEKMDRALLTMAVGPFELLLKTKQHTSK